jgi:hypothetical protein
VIREEQEERDRQRLRASMRAEMISNARRWNEPHLRLAEEAEKAAERHRQAAAEFASTSPVSGSCRL